MGCISSSNKQIFSLRRDGVFNVAVLRVQSEQSVTLAGEGTLELTPNEIVFIAPNHEPVSWALQHLRRYGLNEDIFSFEAGRRCTTGPGIYTFRCCNADQLYSKFQSYINSMSASLGTDRDRTINSTHRINLFDRLNLHQQHANQYLEPSSVFGIGVDQRNILDGHNETNLNSPDSLISPSITSEIIHIPSVTSYSNVNPINNSFNIYMDPPISTVNERNNNSSAPAINNVISSVDLISKQIARTSSLDEPPDECAPILSPARNEAERIYSNIELIPPAPHSANRTTHSGIELVEPSYANVEVNICGKNTEPSHSTPERINSIPNGTVVNYIVLDLDHPRSPSQCSPKTKFGSGQSLIESQTNDIFRVNEQHTDALSLSCGSSTMPKRTNISDVKSNFSDTRIESSGSYTRIDFLKTFALMKSSTNYSDFDPENDVDECRLTRHSKFVRKAYSISE
ncbi:uncharacterized protein LOC142225713 [Haematobia irritans]|uniref:uncharacterized protein LOC142225713 n=1 Tax=Haematobia irritans TaxID=7368 RepID=UPI003F5057E0